MSLEPIFKPWSIAARNGPVAGNLRRIIKEKGLKQCAVARRADMAAHALTDMLRGRRIIYARDILKFSELLEVDVSELFRDLDAEN